MSTAAAMRASRASRVPPREAKPTTWRTWAVVAAAVLLVAFIVAWLFGWVSLTTDPRVVEIQKLQQEAVAQFGQNGGPQTIADATAAVASMNTIRAKTEALPPHLRSQVEQRGSNVFLNAMRARVSEYFDASPAQRQAVLDRQINQEEMMRKAFETASTVANALGMGQGGSAGSGGSTGAGGQAGGSPPGGGPPGGAGPPSASRTEEDRSRRIKSIIDSTTPEQRARWIEYRRAIDTRREERGLNQGSPVR